MFYQNREGSLRVLGAFYVEREAREILERDRRHTALSYRVTGSSVFEDEEGKKEARDGAITYIPVGCDYRHSNSERERILILHLEAHGDSDKRIQVVQNASFAEPLFRNLLAAFESGEAAGYARCMSILYQLFALLCERQPAEGAPPPAAILAGVVALRENFRNPNITVKQLAECCFVSEVYFRRLFRAHFGCSPLQMLQQLRFDYATQLLTSGYYTPKQAATLSGFSDVKYFRTAFQKHYGRSPSSVIPKARSLQEKRK